MLVLEWNESHWLQSDFIGIDIKQISIAMLAQAIDYHYKFNFLTVQAT